MRFESSDGNDFRPKYYLENQLTKLEEYNEKIQK